MTSPIPSHLLYGQKVRLTAFNLAQDLPVLARWYHNPDFLRLFDTSPAYPKNEEALRKMLEEEQQQPAKNMYIFAVRSLEGEDLLGYLEIDEIDWVHGACGLGIGFGDPAHWDKGYGYEAMQLALAFAFRELNLHRVTITVFSYNDRSLALAEKLGFRREGTYRERLQRDGQRYDMHLLGLLRHEWEALNKKS